MLVPSFAMAADNAPEEKVLNVFNWSEYIPQTVLDKFTEETGIKVSYTTFESNEAMFAKLKLLQGKGYDIVVPSSYFVGLMRQAGMLSKIDKSQLKGLENLDPTVMKQAFDPENDYSIPYMWGLTGLLVNKSVVDPATITSWNDLNRPEFKDKVLLSDDLRDTMGIALKAQGYSVNTTDPKEIEAAYTWLKVLKPSVRVFDVSATKQAFISGEVMAGMAWNGDSFIAMQENPDLVFIYPKEGVPIWLDNIVIPSGAEHKKNAHAFINFLLRPEIAQLCVEEFNYTPPNMATRTLLDKKYQDSRIILPAKEDLKNSELTNDIGKTREIYAKFWEKLKAGS